MAAPNMKTKAIGLILKLILRERHIAKELNVSTKEIDNAVREAVADVS